MSFLKLPVVKGNSLLTTHLRSRVTVHAHFNFSQIRLGADFLKRARYLHAELWQRIRTEVDGAYVFGAIRSVPYNAMRYDWQKSPF